MFFFPPFCSTISEDSLQQISIGIHFALRLCLLFFNVPSFLHSIYFTFPSLSFFYFSHTDVPFFLLSPCLSSISSSSLLSCVIFLDSSHNASLRTKFAKKQRAFRMQNILRYNAENSLNVQNFTPKNMEHSRWVKFSLFARISVQY